MQSGICQTVTNCARCANCNISTYYVSCAMLWRPVPGMQSVIFLPMPSCQVRQVLFFLPMPGYDALCQVCGLLYFYLCQMWRPVPGMQSGIFLPMSGCDDLCRVCGLLYFYLCQLWRLVPGIQRVIFLPRPAVPGGLSFVLSTYASYDDLSNYNISICKTPFASGYLALLPIIKISEKLSQSFRFT